MPKTTGTQEKGTVGSNKHTMIKLTSLVTKEMKTTMKYFTPD